MSPRFDRRRDQGQGAGGGGKPRRAEGRPGRGDERSSRPARPFTPRGEWRPDAGGRSSMGEGRPVAGRKPFGRRPDGGERRFDGPRGEGARGDSPRPDRRPGRPGERGADRPYGDRPFSDRPFRERSERSTDRRPESPRGRFERSSFRPGRAPGRPQIGQGRPDFGARRAERQQPLIVEQPSGESERFNAGPADDLIWGRHAAQAALESDRPIHRIWCTSEMRFQPKFLQLLREAKAGGVLVEEVTWARLGQLTDGAVHQGIVLQAAAADTLDLATLIDGCRSLGEPPLLMALDGITDPHNLGAIARSAEALGAHGLVLPQRRSAGLTGSVAKVAAGALEHLPVARVVNLNRSLEALKEEGYRVIGLAGEGSIALSEADLEGPLVIVTGSEASGLSMLTRKHCDQLVRIPLRGATPSLNASVATAMVLYEVARRGWMKTISGSSPAPRIVRPQLPAPPKAEPSTALEPTATVAPAADLDPLPDLEEQELLSPEQAAAAEALVADVMAELQLGLTPAPAPGFSGDIQL